MCVCVFAKFDQFLPVRSHFDTKRPVKIFTQQLSNLLPLGDRFLRLSFVFYDKKSLKEPKMLGKRIDRRNR